MSRREIKRGAACVPVSKAEKPGAATVLPLSNPDTTPGVPGNFTPAEWATVGVETGLTLRERAERAFWEMDAVAELMAADLPPATGPARLVQARWAAARALLLELIEEHEPTPPDRRVIGLPNERLAEQALLSALVRRHSWRVVRPGALVRTEGRNDA